MPPASFQSQTFTPEQIMLEGPFDAEKVTVLTGNNLIRGTVLGKITAGAVPTTGTADGGNTGNGTMTGVTGGVDVKPGIYTATCITAAVNGGVFEVVDPDGVSLGNAVVGVAFANPQINLLANDGGTDYAIGDKFTITVPAGSGKYVTALAAAIDGSSKPTRILAEDVDASAADATGPAYTAGTFNQAALTYGTGHTAATVKAALEAAASRIILKALA